jgi:uroporphyrinogen-III synthase
LDLSKIQMIDFSSPSCVTNFIQLYGQFPEDKQYIFRGNETQKKYNEYVNFHLNK